MSVLSKANASQIGLVGDVVQGASNLGGSIFNAIFQKKENQRNRDFAQQQAQQSRQWQIEQWNMENAYNSPAAQIQRYIDAGLNPNLIYGQLGNGLNSAPSVPQGEAVHGRAPFINTQMSLASTLQGKLLDAQIERMQTQNENDTKFTDAQINRFAELNNLTEVEVKKATTEIDLVNSQIDENMQAIENMKVQWESLSEDVKQKRFETAFLSATQDMRIAGANAEQNAIAQTAVALAIAKLLNVNADTAEKWSQVALNKQLKNTSNSQMHLNNSHRHIAYLTSDLIVAQIQGTKANTERVLWALAGDKNYSETVYGSDNDSWFGKVVHTFTGAMDATFRMAGQLIHGTSVVHQ